MKYRNYDITTLSLVSIPMMEISLLESEYFSYVNHNDSFIQKFFLEDFNPLFFCFLH